jgi:hypothetical protein
MTTETKKETKIIIGFDFGTFHWFQIIKIVNESTDFEQEVTMEISPESARAILSKLDYKAELVYPGIEFHIK